jgi:hypothetical protein
MLGVFAVCHRGSSPPEVRQVVTCGARCRRNTPRGRGTSRSQIHSWPHPQTPGPSSHLYAKVLPSSGADTRVRSGVPWLSSHSRLNTCGDHPVVFWVLSTPIAPSPRSAERPSCVGCDTPFACVEPHASCHARLSTAACDDGERTWPCGTTVVTLGSSGRAFQSAHGVCYLPQ